MLGRISSVLDRCRCAWVYYRESTKRIYPCKLTSEYSIDENGKTFVKIRNFGSGRFIKCSIQDIYADKALLEKFHPSDISKITFIAFGEVFFNMPEGERMNHFCEIRDHALAQNDM